MVIFWATIYVRSSMRYQKLAQGWLNDPENINTVKSIYVYVCYVYLSGGANQSMNSENGMIHPPQKKKRASLYRIIVSEVTQGLTTYDILQLWNIAV